jgi:orotate phosphoribosyltransferase
MTIKADRVRLVRALANHIRDVCANAPVFYTRVAVPSPGNVPLAMCVADDLKTSWVAVKPEGHRAAEFDKFAGAVKPGQDVIIVDDVITSGAMISTCLDLLQEAGARVTAVFALLARRDPEPWRTLKQAYPEIPVFPILTLSDDDITEIVRKH